MKKMFVVAALALSVATTASAASSSGSLTVTANVESAIYLTIESAAGSTSGTGTGSATSALGNINKWGSAPTGFTLTRTGSDWTLAASIGVKVEKANLTSTDYTLTANLQNAPASGVTWKLEGATLSTSNTTLTSTGVYGQTDPYDWEIVVADSAAPGSIGNIINFSAASN